MTLTPFYLANQLHRSVNNLMPGVFLLQIAVLHIVATFQIISALHEKGTNCQPYKKLNFKIV